MLMDPHSWVALLWFWRTIFNQPSANSHGWIGSRSLLHPSHSLYSHFSCVCGSLGVVPLAAITLLHYSASFLLQFAPTNLHIVLSPLLSRAALLSSSELFLFVLLSQLRWVPQPNRGPLPLRSVIPALECQLNSFHPVSRQLRVYNEHPLTPIRTLTGPDSNSNPSPYLTLTLKGLLTNRVAIPNWFLTRSSLIT